MRHRTRRRAFAAAAATAAIIAGCGSSHQPAAPLPTLTVTASAPPTQLAQQAGTYGDVFAACFTTTGCRGITTWGLSDRDTWIRNLFHVEGAPLLYDADYLPKPAYFAAREVLRQLPSTPTP